MATHQLQMAEQQILGFYAAKLGESWADLVYGIGLTLKEYEILLNEGMIDYLSDDAKDEIFEAIKNEMMIRSLMIKDDGGQC